VLFALAPAMAVLGNGARIALLAAVSASEWPWRGAVFHFFHDEMGALVFSGLTVGLYGWIYLVVLMPELRPATGKGHGA
jgi:exosortase/archaeosortase family protein